jgi:hypothetical protein
METTLNYQVLALEVISAAMEDARGNDPEAAAMARQWLEHIDARTLGIDGMEIDDYLDHLNQQNDVDRR